MASSLKIKVNGLTHGVSASLDTPLLYVLHNELHLHGPRFGAVLRSVVLLGAAGRQGDPLVRHPGGGREREEHYDAGRTAGLWAAARGTTAAAPALHPLQQAWIEFRCPIAGTARTG